MQNKNLQGIPPHMGLDTGISLEYGLGWLYLSHAHPLHQSRQRTTVGNSHYPSVPSLGSQKVEAETYSICESFYNHLEHYHHFKNQAFR